MRKISDKEIAIFGKVLRAIGEQIEKNPQILYPFLNCLDDEPLRVVDSKDKENEEPITLFHKIDEFNLYEEAKKMSKEELISKLMTYTVDELKYLIKKLKLGYVREKTKEPIVEFLSDQAKKRTTDVFSDHE